jgi:hypothetical protein
MAPARRAGAIVMLFLPLSFEPLKFSEKHE